MKVNIINQTKKYRVNKSQIKRLLLFLSKRLDFDFDSVSIVFCGKTFIRNLNKKFRNINRATDVLSFDGSIDGYLGDIIICAEIVLQNTNKVKAPFDEEVLRLILHGALHTLGYNHNTPKSEMLELQENLLSSFLKENK